MIQGLSLQGLSPFVFSGPAPQGGVGAGTMPAMPRARAPRTVATAPSRLSPAAASAPAVRLQGLAPVVDARTQLLILGSFPGVASLQAQQYYAHPRNQLWPILAALWPEHPQPPREDYAARCTWLLARGLGLWDVYDQCERQGSLDSAIRAPQVNDFAGLRARCPQLRAVAHNGAESYKHAHHLQGLGLQVYALPSTSPANATWSRERKLAAWRSVVQAVGLLQA